MEATEPKNSEKEIIKRNIQEFLKTHWNDAVFYVRSSVNSKSPTPGMKLLLDQMSEEQNLRLKENLLDYEKLKLKSVLEEDKKTEDNTKNMKRLLQELTKALIAPKPANDTIPDILNDFSIEDCVLFLKKSPDCAGKFMESLSNDRLQAIFGKLDAQELLELTELAGKPSQKNESELQNALESFASDKKTSPFLKNLNNLFDDLAPEKEKIIYDKLVNLKKWEQIEEISSKNFPSFLVSELSPERLKEFFQEIPTEQKVNFILCQEDQNSQDHIFEMMAPKGGKAHEMIAMEIKSVASNEKALSEIKSRKSEVEKSFYTKLRDFLRTRPEVAKPALKKWIDSLKASQEEG